MVFSDLDLFLRLADASEERANSCQKQKTVTCQCAAKLGRERNGINGRGPKRKWEANRCRVAPRIPPRAPPQIRTRPFRASGSSGLRFRYPLLSATVALTRLLMTLSSSRVSQWQFRRPTPPFATHRLPRVGFPAFQRYYEGATTSSVHFNGLIAFGHRYLLALSSFAHTSR